MKLHQAKTWHRNLSMHKTTLITGALGLAAVLGTGCDAKEKEELTRRLNEAGDKAISCKKEASDLKNEVGSLKRQLAQAMANPGRVQLQDPEVIELVASLRGGKPGSGEENLLGKGSLDPKAASKVVMGNAQALQMCYERALKKNAALQFQKGLAVTLGITVKSTGGVEGVDVRPAVDKDMVGCMQSVITRWKFPLFVGENVTIEQKLTLTPKT